jgi:predicted dehydrogenase
MSDAKKATRITLAGGGPDADRRARALRSVEGAAVSTIDGSEQALLEALSAPGDALVVVPPLPDIAGLVRRAVLAGRHVLVCGAACLTSKQLFALDELARRRDRAVLVEHGAAGDEQLAFVVKMTAGPNALWRPRYLRVLRTGATGGPLDAFALGGIARVLAIAGGLPLMVSGVSPRRDDESGKADVAMLTLWFDGGPVARIDVSELEPATRDELVVACDGRTITLRTLDAQAPMVIEAMGRHRGARCGDEWAETVSERPVGETRERAEALAEAFIRAVREGGSAATNADEAGRAALVWERARASMARDGEPLAVQPAPALFQRRPVFEVIEGGGRRVDGSSAPQLTLVSRG